MPAKVSERPGQVASAPSQGKARSAARERSVDVAPNDIERSLKRGAVWALGSQFAVQGIRFVSVVALARLLTPSDYGAAAFAVTLASFSMVLGDLGYGTALVQAGDASQRRASTAFWCSLAAGIVGSGLTALGAYPVALVLGTPDVTPLVIAGGVTLFLVALGSASRCSPTPTPPGKGSLRPR